MFSGPTHGRRTWSHGLHGNQAARGPSRESSAGNAHRHPFQARRKLQDAGTRHLQRCQLLEIQERHAAESQFWSQVSFCFFIYLTYFSHIQPARLTVCCLLVCLSLSTSDFVSVFLCVCLSVYLSVCLFWSVFQRKLTIQDFHDFGFIGALFYSLAAPQGPPGNQIFHISNVLRFLCKYLPNETTTRFFEQFILNFQDFRSFGVLFNPFGGPKRPPRDPIIHVNNISCSPCRYLPKTTQSDLSKSPIYIFMVIDPSRAPLTSEVLQGPLWSPLFHIRDFYIL